MGERGFLHRLGLRARASADEPVDRLERRLGVRFRRRELLERALTHRSYANERGLDRDYERLEFLGDSVLGLVASEWLFRQHPEWSEGRLSAARGALVSRPTLVRWASELAVGPALRLGVGEERSGGREKSSLLADTLEALLGALFIDRGLDAVRQVVEPLLASASQAAGEESSESKTRLQEIAQARGLGLPAYTLVAETGPDHEKRFCVLCRLAGREGRGEGGTKKRAEQRAAAAVIAALGEHAHRGSR